MVWAEILSAYVRFVQNCLLSPVGEGTEVWNLYSTHRNKIKTSLTIEIIFIRSKMKRRKLQLSKSQEQMIQETRAF